VHPRREPRRPKLSMDYKTVNRSDGLTSPFPFSRLPTLSRSPLGDEKLWEGGVGRDSPSLSPLGEERTGGEPSPARPSPLGEGVDRSYRQTVRESRGVDSPSGRSSERGVRGRYVVLRGRGRRGRAHACRFSLLKLPHTGDTIEPRLKGVM